MKKQYSPAPRPARPAAARATTRHAWPRGISRGRGAAGGRAGPEPTTRPATAEPAARRPRPAFEVGQALLGPQEGVAQFADFGAGLFDVIRPRPVGAGAGFLPPFRPLFRVPLTLAARGGRL